MKQPLLPTRYTCIRFQTNTITWPRSFTQLLIAREEILKAHPDAKDAEITIQHKNVYDGAEYYLEFLRVIDNVNFEAEMREYKVLKAKYDTFQKEVIELSRRYE